MRDIRKCTSKIGEMYTLLCICIEYICIESSGCFFHEGIERRGCDLFVVTYLNM